MTFDDFENLFTLFCTVVGLLFCLFKYIELPKRRYLYLIIFFLTHFFSDYYWAIYGLIMHSSPNVSGFMSYLGWNISYLFLFRMVFRLRGKGNRYFHPLMLWPVLTNIPLLILYLTFGGIFNNLWQVGITTITMVFCMKELLYYSQNKKKGISHFPRLSFLILLFLIFGYGMWTASCFDWKSELINPYLYFTILAYISSLFFAWGTEKDYEDEGQVMIKKTEAEFRLQTLLKTIASYVILGACAGGYFIVLWMKNSIPFSDNSDEASNIIITVLYAISFLLILLVMILIYVIITRYKKAKEKRQNLDAGKLSSINFISTVCVTLFLMVFAISYNTKLIYNASVAAVYDTGEEKIRMFSTELENYLTGTETTLRVAADSIDLMERNGASSQDIYLYLIYQTSKQYEQLDENFAGIYAYVDGVYMDGSGWIPPEGFNPTTRDWYKTVVKANGEVVIVSPYIDALTGDCVITIGKCISSGEMEDELMSKNVVCLDVIVNYVKDITEQIDISGKGYGMVVNEDGFIVAHRNAELNGENITEFYGKELLDTIITAQNQSFQFNIDDKKCSIFTYPILNQWHAVIVVDDTELFETVHSQLVVNILISLITFSLILFFYYLGFKNERTYGKKIEEMNIQTVTALATAIDAKDNYTNGHSSRVAEYSRMIAERLGFSESRQNEIYMMGLLHDVGKIGVPDDVINKSGKLTDEEFELIKNHPVIGSRILRSIKDRQRLSIGARWHHERFGGGGYPDGMAGDEIPIEARIIAVADAYDAMTSSRSYRELMPQDKVREEIVKGMGTQFDPEFATIMIQMIDEDTDYSMCGK